MYIRESKTKNKKTDKVYIKHSLVESVRTERGPRQRLVMTLGKLELDRSLWKELANALEAFLHGNSELEHLSLFELPKELLEELNQQRAIINYHRNLKSKLAGNTLKEKSKPIAEKRLHEIDIDTIGVTESRSLGPELVANDVWSQLEFSNILAECGLNEKDIALAASVIWGRLLKPGSDLSTWHWLRNETSLPDFFDVDVSRVHKDRIYEIADKLLLHKDTLESKLYETQCDLFSLQRSIFLFEKGSENGNTGKVESLVIAATLVFNRNFFSGTTVIWKQILSGHCLSSNINPSTSLMDPTNLFPLCCISIETLEPSAKPWSSKTKSVSGIDTSLIALPWSTSIAEFTLTGIDTSSIALPWSTSIAAFTLTESVADSTGTTAD